MTVYANDYKSEVHPVWCPGCGHFMVLRALTQSMAWLELDKNRTAVFSGIGCSSRLPAYVDTYGFHGLHGRALPLATGAKLANPELNVIVVSGDGDAYAIGGNHFLHACRRNLDMTLIVMDNAVYGMTKGQPSPTTEPDWKSKLAPQGTHLRPFKPAALALSAGASFVARGFAGNPAELSKLITAGIQHRGFSFIEVLSPCVTFRPEELNWRHEAEPLDAPPTDDLCTAMHNLLNHHHLTTGIYYQADLPVWAPDTAEAVALQQLEEDFQP